MLYLRGAAGTLRGFNCYVCLIIKALKRVYRTYPISPDGKYPLGKRSGAGFGPEVAVKGSFPTVAPGRRRAGLRGRGGCAGAESASSSAALFWPGRRKRAEPKR